MNRLDLTDIDVESWDFQYTSAGPRGSETHGGDDVGIFASGPGASLFHRAHEQTHIFQVMTYAACIGDYIGYTAGNEYCEMSE